MMSALINALCYKRARGELLLSQRTIQKNMSLPAMARCTLRQRKRLAQRGLRRAGKLSGKYTGFLLANAEYRNVEARAFEQHNYMSRRS